MLVDYAKVQRLEKELAIETERANHYRKEWQEACKKLAKIKKIVEESEQVVNSRD